MAALAELRLTPSLFPHVCSVTMEQNQGTTQLEYIDTHCHLDLILNRYQVSLNVQSSANFFNGNFSDDAVEELIISAEKKTSQKDKKDRLEYSKIQGRLHLVVAVDGVIDVIGLLFSAWL